MGNRWARQAGQTIQPKTDANKLKAMNRATNLNKTNCKSISSRGKENKCSLLLLLYTYPKQMSEEKKGALFQVGVFNRINGIVCLEIDDVI
jgi:hypothetical protein